MLNHIYYIILHYLFKYIITYFYNNIIRYILKMLKFIVIIKIKKAKINKNNQ